MLSAASRKCRVDRRMSSVQPLHEMQISSKSPSSDYEMRDMGMLTNFRVRQEGKARRHAVEAVTLA